MTKSTFKDILFLGVLNCFYTLCWKGETYQGFPNSTKGLGEKSPLPVRGRGMGNFVDDRDFFIGW